MFLTYTLVHTKNYAQFFCQVKDLMKIHNRGFIHIAYVVVRSKKLKVLRTDSASMKCSFFEYFWALTPQTWTNFTEIFFRGSTLADKNVVSKFFEGFFWDGTKVCTFRAT